MGAFSSKLRDFFSSLFGGGWDSAGADAEKKSHPGGAFPLDDATRKAGAREAASAALAAIQKAAETAVAYVSGLLGAVTSSAVVVSSYGALKRAAGAAGNTVMELVRRLLGSDAAAAAKDRFGAVAAALRGGASSFAATVEAALDAACSAAVPASAREALAAVLAELTAGKAALVVAEIRAVIRVIPLVEELLGLVIPWEVQATIAVVVVAAGHYLALCAGKAGAPAAAAGAMMKAPGGGPLLALCRSAFQANPAAYFSLLRSAGPEAAAAAFGFTA